MIVVIIIIIVIVIMITIMMLLVQREALRAHREKGPGWRSVKPGRRTRQEEAGIGRSSSMSSISIIMITIISL